MYSFGRNNFVILIPSLRIGERRHKGVQQLGRGYMPGKRQGLELRQFVWLQNPLLTTPKATS